METLNEAEKIPPIQRHFVQGVCRNAWNQFIHALALRGWRAIPAPGYAAQDPRGYKRRRGSWGLFRWARKMPLMTALEILAKHGITASRIDYMIQRRGLKVHGSVKSPIGPPRNLYEESDVLTLSVRKKRSAEPGKRRTYKEMYSDLSFYEQVSKYRKKRFGAHKIAKLTGRKIDDVLGELARGCAR